MSRLRVVIVVWTSVQRLFDWPRDIASHGAFGDVLEVLKIPFEACSVESSIGAGKCKTSKIPPNQIIRQLKFTVSMP